MNDIRRTILWVIFGFSLVMLWDQWQVYNGRNATFFPGSKPAVVQPQAPAGAASAPSSLPSSVPTASSSVAGADQIAAAVPAVAAPATAAAAARELVVVDTDVFKLTFDTEGGSLVRAEFTQIRRHGGQEHASLCCWTTARTVSTWPSPA